MNDNDDVDTQEGDIPFEQSNALDLEDELHGDGLDDVKAQCVEVDLSPCISDILGNLLSFIAHRYKFLHEQTMGTIFLKLQV